MDINICIDRLGLNANIYKLNQSNPPHSITEWIGSDAQPTQEELETAWASYTAEHDAQAYARNRKEEYNQLNQFEMQFDDKRDGTTTWVDAIDTIKTKYPKG
jgi:hypothetical protein